VRPGWKSRFGDEVVGVGDAHASSFEQFALTFGLQRHLSAKDGVDGFCGSDVLVLLGFLLHTCFRESSHDTQKQV
jgi:hypothetical protein